MVGGRVNSLLFEVIWLVEDDKVKAVKLGLEAVDTS